MVRSIAVRSAAADEALVRRRAEAIRRIMAGGSRMMRRLALAEFYLWGPRRHRLLPASVFSTAASAATLCFDHHQERGERVAGSFDARLLLGVQQRPRGER